MYVGLDCGSCSKVVHLMGNEQSMVMMWISYSLFSRNYVMVMGGYSKCTVFEFGEVK